MYGIPGSALLNRSCTAYRLSKSITMQELPFAAIIILVSDCAEEIFGHNR